MWKPAQKTGCLQIAENHQAWEPDLCRWKKSDTWNGSCKLRIKKKVRTEIFLTHGLKEPEPMIL